MWAVLSRYVRKELLLLAFCFLVSAQTPPVIRLYPVDDTPRDPAFRSYVRRLKAAVDARNTKVLRKLVDEHEVIVGGSDEDKGWAKFVNSGGRTIAASRRCGLRCRTCFPWALFGSTLLCFSLRISPGASPAT